MSEWRVPAEEIVKNVLKLMKSGYEEESMPLIEAYIHWAMGNDAHFNTGDEFSDDFENRSLKEAQDYLAGGD